MRSACAGAKRTMTMRPSSSWSGRDESDDVTSFLLGSEDGSELPGFEPGQHLPVRIAVDDDGVLEDRTYSLSDTPTGRTYRISVKRHERGRVSGALHDRPPARRALESRAARR